MKKVVKPRVPRTHASGKWTKAMYFSRIRAMLRRGFRTYPPRIAVLKAAETGRYYKEPVKKRGVVQKYKVGPNKGKTRYTRKPYYACESCKKDFKRSEIEVDHIDPCGSLKDYSDLPRFVKTLFCEEDNLRVLCKPCHKGVTYGTDDK